MGDKATIRQSHRENENLTNYVRRYSTYLHTLMLWTFEEKLSMMFTAHITCVKSCVVSLDTRVFGDNETFHATNKP